MNRWSCRAGRIGRELEPLLEPSGEDADFTADAGHMASHRKKAVGLGRVEERQDVRVLKARSRLDLDEETISSHEGGELRLEHRAGLFDRHLV